MKLILWIVILVEIRETVIYFQYGLKGAGEYFVLHYYKSHKDRSFLFYLRGT
jgi:hypothetical protein